MYKNIVIVVSEAFSWNCSLKKLSEKFGRIHGETPVIESFTSNATGKCEQRYLRKALYFRCFTLNFEKFSGHSFYRTSLNGWFFSVMGSFCDSGLQSVKMVK